MLRLLHLLKAHPALALGLWLLHVVVLHLLPLAGFAWFASEHNH